MPLRFTSMISFAKTGFIRENNVDFEKDFVEVRCTGVVMSNDTAEHTNTKATEMNKET